MKLKKEIQVSETWLLSAAGGPEVADAAAEVWDNTTQDRVTVG